MEEEKPIYLAQGVEYYPDTDDILLMRCPKCGKENYALAVADGICCWCGFDGRTLLKQKTMDYKKKYEEALKRAKEMYDQGMSVERIEHIFPELVESEDERIRKEIIYYLCEREIIEFPTESREKADWISWLEKQRKPQDKGEISDGYHTFNELYYYRMLYNAAFFNMLPKGWVHKSKKHHDGEECFGGGWFIVMANLPTGQISDHYELKDWDLFQIPEKEVADKWDGHTPQEVADRLYKYLLEKQGEQSKKVAIWKHWKDGIAGNGEGTPVYLIKDGYTYSISSCISYECDYIELSELDMLLSEKKDEQKFIELYDRPECDIKDDASITSRLGYIPEELKPIADFIIDYAHWNLHKAEWNHPVAEVPLFRVLDALISKGKGYQDCQINC